MALRGPEPWRKRSHRCATSSSSRSRANGDRTGSDGARFEVARFEDVDLAGRRFDLCTAGQAWHWVDPARGRAKAAEIAAACKAPTSSIQQVLQALTRAHLLGSNSSASGGYELRADPDQLSLLQVIEAVEGPVDGERCMLSSQPCHLLEGCPIHRVWVRAVERGDD